MSSIVIVGIGIEIGPLCFAKLVGDLAEPHRLEEPKPAQQAFLALDALVEFG
jgi:hypothetical protein